MLELRDGSDRNRDSVLVGHGELADVVERAPRLGSEPHPDVVFVLADPVLGSLCTEDAGLYGGRDDLGVHARAHRLLAVHLDAELRLAAFEVVVEVDKPLDPPDPRLHLFREPLDLVEFLSEDPHRNRGPGWRAVLGRVHLDVGPDDVGKPRPHHLHGLEGVADLPVGPLLQVERHLAPVGAAAAAARTHADPGGAHVGHLVLHVHRSGSERFDLADDRVRSVQAGAAGGLHVNGDLPRLDLREELDPLADHSVDPDRSDQDRAHHPDPARTVVGEVGGPAERAPDQAPDEPEDPLQRERQYPDAGEPGDRGQERVRLEEHAAERERRAEAQEDHERRRKRPVAKEPGARPGVRARPEGPLEEPAVAAPERMFLGIGLLDAAPRRLHQVGAERRIDDERHHQRRREPDDEGHRQVGHEVPDDPGPDEERRERAERGDRRGDDRAGDLGGGLVRRVRTRVAVLAVAVDVLDDHHRVVHQHPEHEDEAEQHHHVQRVADPAEYQERGQHRERDGHPHEEGVPEAYERHQASDHQQQPRNDVVLELVHHPPDLDGDVADHRGVDALGQHLVPAVEFGVHEVGNPYQVGAGAFFDAQGHRRFLVHPRAAGLVLEPEDHVGHVAHKDRLAVTDLDHEVLDLRRLPHFGGQPDQVLESADRDLAARDVAVFPRHRHHDVGEAELEEGQAFRVHLHVDLALATSDHVRPVDPGDRLQVLLDLLGHLGEALASHRPRQGDHHDGDLREIHVLDPGVFGLRGQVGFREVHLFADARERRFEIGFGVELDRDAGEALARGGADLLDPGDRLDLRFDGPRDQRLHVRRADAGIDRVDEDEGDLHLGERLPGHGDVDADPTQAEDEDQEIDRQLMPDGVFRDVHGALSPSGKPPAPAARRAGSGVPR